MSWSAEIKLTPSRILALVVALVALIAGSAAVSAALSRGKGTAAEAKKDAGEEHHEEGHVKLSPAAIEKAGLQMLTAGPGKVAVLLSLPGEVAVNADLLAHVTPRVGGTVRDVRKQLGDRVAKGEVLATLDSRELAELRREVGAAKEKLDLAEANFARQKRLWEEKISAEKDYLAAKQAQAEARIDYRGALQKLNAVGGAGPAGGAGYALVAPLSGTIIEKHISVGEVLKDDTQAFAIADLAMLWVNVTVYARDLSKVRVGQHATVRAEGIAEPARGTIGYVGQVVGEETRSAIARVVIDTPGPSWRPGLFVTADVTIEEIDARVTVVDDAIQTVEGKPVVFVQEGDAFEARGVKVGRRGSNAGAASGPLVEVLEGVPAGARYVGKNSFILKAELGKSEAGHEH